MLHLASIFLVKSWSITKKRLSIVFLCMCLDDQSCPAPCNPVICSLPGSSFYGILQERILEWGVISSSRVSSWPRGRTHISCGSCIADRFFTAQPPGKIWKLAYDPAIPPLGIYWEKTTTLKDMYPSVHCSTIYNSQDVEATKIFINRYMDKEVVIHIFMKYYSALKSLF